MQQHSPSISRPYSGVVKLQYQSSLRTVPKLFRHYNQQNGFTRLALLLACLSLLFVVTANIQCALPAGSTYKAGDPIILDWGSDGTSPTVSDITSINATLYCNNNVKIANVTIPNLTGPYNWTVPSVGNATTVGGTVGVCPSNAFHIEYSGQAAGFLNIVSIPWGPVQCGTITILPAPNGTVTTTTTTTTATASATVSPTQSTDSSNGGGLSITIVVIIAVAAAVLVTLAIVGIVIYFRKKRHQRKLDDALMPWTSNTNGRFSKVSSADDEQGDVGMASAAAGAGVSAETGGRISYEMKSQPMLPQPNRSTYYPDDGDYNNYGYYQQQQQQQQLLQRQQQNDYQSQGYEGYNEGDSYYNPYYASGVSSVANQSNPSFYNMNNSITPGNRVRSPPFSQSGDFIQQQHTSGYFPPPPPGPLNSSPLSYGRGPTTSAVGPEVTGSALTSLPTISSATSSPKRAPQTVLQEMGRKEAEIEQADNDMPSDSPTTKVEIMYM
ncbi:hypothetical protein BGZ46_006523 [Entomortierella lignicola]|nr:hypothetical protein BGZ46_006523 [Entomortierella lignicola]